MTPKQAMALTDEQAYRFIKDLVNEQQSAHSGHRHTDECGCLRNLVAEELEPVRQCVFDLMETLSQSANEVVDDLTDTYLRDPDRRFGEPPFRARMIARFKAQRELFRMELAEAN